MNSLKYYLLSPTLVSQDWPNNFIQKCALKLLKPSFKLDISLDPFQHFHQISPLGRFGHRVDMSVRLWPCMTLHIANFPLWLYNICFFITTIFFSVFQLFLIFGATLQSDLENVTIHTIRDGVKFLEFWAKLRTERTVFCRKFNLLSQFGILWGQKF